MMARFGEPYLPANQVLLGEPLRSIRRTTFTRTPLLCWEVHPRSPIWDEYAHIEEDVKDYLQNHHELRTASGALCSLCFVGRSETQVKAVIVVHCEDISCRSMALRIIGDSPEWRTFKRNHPGFALMSAPKAPSPCAPYVDIDSLAVYCSDDADLSVGTTVRFGSQASQTEPALARIGPTIFHDGQPYIISVSHQLRNLLTTFEESENANTSGPLHSSGSSISDDDEDAWDLFDEDEIRPTTPGTDSPVSEPMDVTPVLQGMSLHLEPDSLASFDGTVIQSRISVQDISQEQILQRIEAVPDDSNTAHEWKKVIGEVICKSSDIPSKQHDWSLIKPSQAMYNEMKGEQGINALFGLEPSRSPTRASRAAEIPRSYKTVWLATSKGLYEEAVLSGSRCSYRLPGTHRFLNVLPLHTCRPLARGESGTAVLDLEDGSWYGQIIAAQDDGNVAYVLPATGILESIAQSLGVTKESLTFTDEPRAEFSYSLPIVSKLPYSYRPLQRGEIRLLRLLPSSNMYPGSLEATIQHVYLEDQPKYTALSYVWSRETPDHTIHVNGWRLGIAPDLAAALSVLRQNMRTDLVWVDAVCINHDDQEEKFRQVVKMSEIYTQAQEVVAWLGSVDEETNRAIDYLLDTSLSRWELSSYQPHRVSVLCRLFERKWFHRIWVAQEVALARKITVFCGPREIPWNVLKTFASFWSSHVRLLTGAAEREEMYQLQPLLRTHQEQSSYRHLEVGALLFPKAGSLADLLHLSKSLTVSDLRDRIYALLALTKERTDIKIDYSKSTTEVYVQAVDHMIRHRKSLDVILWPWIPQQDRLRLETELPSWMPDWNFTSAFASQPEHTLKPKTALHQPAWLGFQTITRHLLSRHHFHASGHAAFHFDIRPSNILFENTDSNLPVKRVRERPRLDRVTHTLRCSGQIAGPLLELDARYIEDLFGQWPLRTIARDKRSDQYESFWESFWRTLVADGDINNRRHAPLWYGEVLADMRKDWVSTGRNVQSFIASPDDRLSFRTLAKRIATVVSGRRLAIFAPQAGRIDENMLRKSNPKMLALVPEGAREDDLICILFGCSVPVVLRRVNPSSDDQWHSSEEEGVDAANGEELAYTLVGESFVYGMMDGEALSNPAFPRADFALV